MKWLVFKYQTKVTQAQLNSFRHRQEACVHVKSPDTQITKTITKKGHDQTPAWQEHKAQAEPSPIDGVHQKTFLASHLDSCHVNKCELLVLVSSICYTLKKEERS